MGFLEENYELPNAKNKYMKFQKGSNKFRIVSKPIIGRVDRTEEGGKRKPIRTKELKPSIDPDKPSKHFRAMVVWNYAEEGVQVLEITQKNIQKIMVDLFSSSDWGDPRNYDIKVERKGEKLDTEYIVSPLPPKDIDPNIEKEVNKIKVDLSALYENKDPFEQNERFE